MTDLDRRLAALGETPLAEQPALPELQQRARRIRRRRQARRVGGVLAVVALGLVLWNAVDGLDTQRVEFPPVDEGGTQPEPPARWPLGLVVAEQPGILVVPFASPDEAIRLAGDRFYEAVRWAFPDQRGGLVFQHEVTPLPWPSGAVLWLRAGATHPEVLIPPEAAGEPASSSRAGVVPVGMANDDDGRALFVYAVDSTIMVADLDAGGAIRPLADLDGWIQADMGRYHAITGGGVVAAIDREVEDCVTVTLIRVDDGAALPATPDCLPGDDTWVTWARTLSHDGRSLGMLSDPEVGSTGLTATVIELSTGATSREATISVPDDLILAGLTSSPGGWLVYIETLGEILLQDLDGDVRVRIDKSTLPLSEWRGMELVYHHRFDLASGAALGPGSGELPCRPSTGELPAQDLPEAVAATRRLLFDLASACDYEGLAALAGEHATLVFAHHTDTRIGELLESEDDLVRSWVADGRADLSDQGIRSREPLATLAGLLREAPLYVERAADLPDSQPQREGPVWVWPAEWVEASHTVETEDAVLPNPAVADYRVGIAPDGTWRFFMAGDFHGDDPPPAPVIEESET